MASLLQTKRLVWGAVFALVTLVALLSHFSGKRYVAAVEAVEHTLSVEVAIGGVLSLLKDAETGPRDLDKLRLRLRELSDKEVDARARPYRLSMSVGAAFMPGPATSVAQLLDEADAAMYAQKNARRLAGGVSIPPPA